MNITCNAWTERPTGGDGTLRPCDQRAVMVILTEEEVLHAGDVEETLTVAWGYCREHAPEAVHEMRSSADESDFLVVTLGL